jgi:hypothetical protein
VDLKHVKYTTNNTDEVRIPRVRFKPGYQRVWRESRLALKELLGLKFCYQKQLTKYLLRFYKSSHKNNFIHNELSFSKLLIYSRIVPDYNTFLLFFNNKITYLNGKNPITKDLNCVVKDFIQLVVSK